MVKVNSHISSYDPNDAILLLKDISDLMKESSTETREQAIQAGIHYSEMLPTEYKPSKAYMDLFFSSLQHYKHKLAIAVGVVAEQIIQTKGNESRPRLISACWYTYWYSYKTLHTLSI